VLLFLQWPLRVLVRLYSREANDLGQVLGILARGAQKLLHSCEAFSTRYDALVRALQRRICDRTMLGMRVALFHQTLVSEPLKQMPSAALVRG
jgi:hypothetical protein